MTDSSSLTGARHRNGGPLTDRRTMRSCRKTACRWPAAASLSYRYDTRQVWLLDLSEEPDPSLYDLCPHHADSLVVMRGWERVDQRTHAEPVAEPAGRDLSSPDRPPVGAGGYGDNRYRALAAELPRLAAELAAAEEAGEAAEPAETAAEPAETATEEAGRAGEAAESDAAEAAEADTAPETAAEVRQSPQGGPVAAPAATEPSERPRAAPLPSRELMPMPAPELSADVTGGTGPDATPIEVPGQLSMPVPDASAGEVRPEGDEAVVVPFEVAGRRRRTPAPTPE